MNIACKESYKMKRILSIIAASAFVTGVANAGELSSYVVKGANAADVESQPWHVSHQELPGGYLKVTVGEGWESAAISGLSRFGEVVENSILERPESVKMPPEVYVHSESFSEYDDPYLISQPELASPYNRVIEGIESQRDKRKKVKVVILDTGARAHEDIVYQGGYSMTTLFEQNESDDYTDLTIMEDPANPDVGTLECYSGHGNQMAGVVGATQNNGKGIAGIADVDLYMGRVMSTDCTTMQDVGSLSDLYLGLTWATGSYSNNEIPKPDFVNVSLAAESVCPGFIQEAIDVLVEQGTTVVVSAGNYGDSVAKYAPANCQNVIVVGSHGHDGIPSTFSNSGDQVDITAIGHRLTTTGENGYYVYEGTSSAAAAVTGMLAVVKENFPDATPAQLEEVIKKTAVDYEDASCGGDCGEGMIDLYASLRSAEQLLDPSISFAHAFDETEGCEVTREMEGLAEHMNVCSALTANVTMNYSDDIDYNFKLLRREVGSVDWVSGTEILKQVKTNDEEIRISILDVDSNEYEYAVATCEGDASKGDCPFLTELDASSIVYPSSCL
tara:strand:+ start:1170 stop:2846 length:1677 start_codon:yes stop_codon:yes gene_type:complete